MTPRISRGITVYSPHWKPVSYSISSSSLNYCDGMTKFSTFVIEQTGFDFDVLIGISCFVINFEVLWLCEWVSEWRHNWLLETLSPLKTSMMISAYQTLLCFFPYLGCSSLIFTIVNYSNWPNYSITKSQSRYIFQKNKIF